MAAIRVPRVVQRVPSLQEQCIEVLSRNPEYLHDASVVDEGTATMLLYRILAQGRLNVDVVRVFQRSSHTNIVDALADLNVSGADTMRSVAGTQRGCRRA